MSLVPKPEMTEKNLAAHRANGRKSRGAASAQGKERARAANLRHGFYSQMGDEALEALGEDPAALAALIEGAYEQWRPANSHQAGLVEKLARLQWRMDRAERRQASLEVQHLRRVEQNRREQVGPIRDRYLNMINFLACVPGDSARPDFYASPGYIHKFTQAFAGAMDPSLEELLRLLHRLGKPQTEVGAPGPLPAEATDDNTWQGMRDFLEEQGEGFPLPHPEIPVAEGAERAELREKLRQLAVSEHDITEQAWEPYFDKNWRSLTTAERDVLLADPELSAQTAVARREESTCFREFWRLGTILTKMQQQAEARPKGVRMEAGLNGVRPESEVPGAKSEKQKSGAGSEEPVPSAVAAISDRRRRGAPETRNMRRPETAATAGKSSDLAEQVSANRAERSGQIHSPATGGHPVDRENQSESGENQSKNEGASGDVAENKGGAKAERVADAPLPSAHSTENVPPASPGLPQSREMAL